MKLKFAFSLIILLVLIFNTNFLVFAETTTNNATDALNQILKQQANSTSDWKDKASTAENTVNNVNEQFQSKANELDSINKKIEEYNKKLSEINEQIFSLKDKIQLLDDYIEVTNLKIRTVEIQIEEKKQDIFQNYQKIEVARVALDNQKIILLKYIELLYKQEKVYFDSENQLSTNISLFFKKGGISDIITQRKYFTVLQSIGKDIYKDLQSIQVILKIKQQQYETDQERLTSLESSLKDEQANLESQKEAKNNLLAQTMGEQTNYQKLLDETIKQKDEAEKDLLAIQTNIKDIEGKIEVYLKNSNRKLTQDEINQRIQILQALGNGGKLGLDWPVEPLKGLSATFHDPSYKRFFGVNHNAIDIPTPQGTDIKVPADGVVLKVKDNGFGYSYLIVAHPAGVVTLYGHVSKFLAQEGDVVLRGDVIAKSGGAPGTRGAGWMTTGAHLHFEVMENGKHVDPLGFLDNSKLN